MKWTHRSGALNKHKHEAGHKQRKLHNLRMVKAQSHSEQQIAQL